MTRLTSWQPVLRLDSRRAVRAGSTDALAAAIRRGADLRVRTDFRHNDHIDTASASNELVVETSEFRATYLIAEQWVAGVMTLRQPIVGPEGFGPQSSMSYFLYNQDGHQAIARVYVDGKPRSGKPGPSNPVIPANMPKYHASVAWDGDTNAPSQNFIYDFETYEFLVRDDWREVLHHDASGRAQSGRIEELGEALAQGADIKIGIRGLCDDGQGTPEHEVFIQTGSNYYYPERKLVFAGSHPLVRVRPAIPLQYQSGAWDFGWLFLRSDGEVTARLCDPYTLQFRETKTHHAIRWFVRC